MNREDMIYVLSNTKFMDWIIKKLSMQYYIDDDKYNLDENDRFYAKKLRVLYQLVEKYAVKNNIEPIMNTDYNLYCVDFKGDLFFVYKKNDTFGCFKNTLNKEDISGCVNFHELQKDQIQSVIDYEESVFSKLKEDISILYRKGISSEYIIQITEKILYDLHNEKNKTLVKKK